MTTTLFVGTYTKLDDGEAMGSDAHRSEGIFVFHMDPETGQLERVAAVAAGPDPSFLEIHPSRRSLFAVNELGGGQATAFALDVEAGSLTMLNSESTGGAHPCYVSLDPSARWLMVANYTGGSLAVLPVEAGGRLGPIAFFDQHEGSGPNAARQEKAHAHCILPDPSGRFILSADLGMDLVWVYRIDPRNGKLTPNDPRGYQGVPGAGPRHLAFHPNGHFVYIANELASTVTACAWDSQAGTLRALQSEPLLPQDFHGENTAADIHITPDGRFLYVSNRGHDSLACFAVDAQSGRLTFVAHTPSGGKNPRNFAIHPNGRFLLSANQDGNNILVFRIDSTSGHLAPTGVEVSVPKPVCLKLIEP